MYFVEPIPSWDTTRPFKSSGLVFRVGTTWDASKSDLGQLLDQISGALIASTGVDPVGLPVDTIVPTDGRPKERKVKGDFAWSSESVAAWFAATSVQGKLTVETEQWSVEMSHRRDDGGRLWDIWMTICVFDDTAPARAALINLLRESVLRWLNWKGFVGIGLGWRFIPGGMRLGSDFKVPGYGIAVAGRAVLMDTETPYEELDVLELPAFRRLVTVKEGIADEAGVRAMRAAFWDGIGMMMLSIPNTDDGTMMFEGTPLPGGSCLPGHALLAPYKMLKTSQQLEPVWLERHAEIIGKDLHSVRIRAELQAWERVVEALGGFSPKADEPGWSMEHEDSKLTIAVNGAPRYAVEEVLSPVLERWAFQNTYGDELKLGPWRTTSQ